MAIDPRIPMMAQAPVINTPAENQAIVADSRLRQQTVQQNDLKLADQRRAAEEQAAVQRIMAEAGGDWSVALPRIRQAAPGQAVAVEKHLAEQRKAGADAMKVELENERGVTERGLALLRAAAAAPELYGQLRQYVGQLDPELAPLLPEQYDPAVIDQLQTMGQTAQENLVQKHKALELFMKGDALAGLGQALSAAVDEEDWQEAMQAAAVYGVPPETRAIFGEWSEDAPARAAQLAMSPKERADVTDNMEGRALQAARDAETKRHNQATEGLTGQANAIRAARPPAGSGGSGGARTVTPTAALNMTRSLRNDFNRETTAASEVARQLMIMEQSLQAVKSGAAAAGSQGVLVTFQKILDPDSVVRESEYARSASGLALLSRIEGKWMQISQGGAGVPVRDLEEFVGLARQWAREQRKFTGETKRQIDGIAEKYDLDASLITRDIGGSVEGTSSEPAPAQGGGPATSATPSDYEAYKRRRQGGR